MASKESTYSSMTYEPVIGLEVHVELNTKSKMFCGCLAEFFGRMPNTNTCPVCLGLPGALPVPNKKAIEWCILIGLSLNCEIPLSSKFDRKNYFYPDLPKGYQISQYDQPFCRNGHLTLKNGKAVRIKRVHMEEDTGKLFHDIVNGKKASLIDFNRSGVPLVEIVTEPDFHSAEEVKEYLQKLQQIVRYLGVSAADMEKGQMRLEPNISLGTTSELPKYKVEVKNINSFRFVERAIAFEIKRQTTLLEQGKVPTQETRGWHETKQQTISQRSKEEAHDYRYFPEPDIPPFEWTTEYIEKLRNTMSELPDVKQFRFKNDYNLSSYDVEILTREKTLADYFEEAVMVGKTHSITPKEIANTIINKKTASKTLLPAQLIDQIRTAKQVATIDESELETIIETVLKENQKAVAEYRNGKETVLMFLIGQVMRELGKKVDVEVVKKKLPKQSSKKRIEN